MAVDPIAAAIAAQQRQADTSAQTQVQTSGPQPDPIAVQIRNQQLEADRTQENLLRWRAANDKVDPARRADVLRYAAAGDFSPSFVDQNLDAVKRKVDADGVDWPLVAHRQPALVQILTEKPEMHPVVRDDTANLGGIEWYMKAPLHAAIDAAGPQQLLVMRQFWEAQGLGGPENRKEIERLSQEYSNRDYGNDSVIQDGLIATAKVLPQLVGDIAARAIGAYLLGQQTAAEGAAVGGAITAPAGGEGAAPGGVIGGFAGAGLGQFVGSAVFNYYEGIGPLYWQLSQLKDSSGNSMDPAAARAFANAGALVQAGLMAGFLGRMGTLLPGVKSLMAKIGATTVEKALAERTTAEVMKAGVKRFGEHWLLGGTLMAAQSGISAIAEQGARASEFGERFDWSDVGESSKRGFEQGLTDFWLLSAVGTGREMYKELGRNRASAESAVRAQQMVRGAMDSKLLERYPEGFRELVEKMKESPEAVKNFLVPVEEWTRYWQEQKVDPGEMAASVVGDGGKSFTEAMKTNGDLAIPSDQYLTKLGKTEHAEKLLMDVKLQPDELTPRQFQGEQKALRERMKEEAKVRGAELEQGKKEVFDFIAQQARAAKVPKADAEANAKLVADYAGTLALRLGVSVREAAALGALGQLRILGPKGEAVAQTAREHFQRFLRPEASQLLEQRLTSISPENRAKEMYLDRVSGLRTREAFDATPAPAGLDQVLVITSPDVKGINDHPTAGGHDVANEFMRAIGKALGERPDAARDGTNFLVHVKDQADADALLAKVRAELGNDKLNVVGELGGKAAAALDAADNTVYRRRGVPEEGKPAPEPLRPGETPLPKRGELTPGLDVAGLKFGEGKAAGTVPEHLVEKVKGMSDAEYAQKAYLDAVEITKADGKTERVKTGMLSRQGWDNIQRKAHVASIDLKGLKAANLKYGKATGNKMLFFFADVVSHLGGSSFDAAHLSGDEYAFQHNDPLELERFVNRVKERLKGLDLAAKNKATGIEEPITVDFRHGIGPDYGLADRALNAAKRKEVGVGAGDQGPSNRSSDQRAGGLPGRDASQAQEASAGGSSGQGEVGAPTAERVVGGIGRSLGAVPDRGSARGGVPDNSTADVRRDGAHRAGADLLAGAGGGVAPGEDRRLGRGAQRQGFGEVVAHVEGLSVTYHEEGQGGGPKRGSIQMQVEPNGRPRAFDIRVLEGDRSTLAHETAHFLSWSLHDIVTSDLATPDLVRDYTTLIKWAGFSSPEERQTLNRERTQLGNLEKRTPAQEARLKELTAKEERISHGWEQYLAEGKAPAPELQGVFSKFKGWLLDIYRGVLGVQKQYRDTYGQEIALSPEVRGVFDRLLAQDDALRQAEADSGRTAIPPPLVTAAMSPTEREEYRKALVDARLSAETELGRRAAELENHQVQQAREKARAEVTQELDKQSVYRAMRYLQDGVLVGDDGLPLKETPVPETLLDKEGQPYKLNRKDFVDAYGPDVARLMPSHIWAPTKKGGVPVGELAPLLGFESGDDLVDAFRKAEPRERAIENQVQNRMDAAYGPALQRIADAAMAATHNYDAARATLMELRAIGKELDPAAARRVKSIRLETLRATADRLVQETAVDALDPATFARQERQAALKAAELWGRGDKDKAAEQLEARLLNQLLYRAARDTRQRLDKLRSRLEDVSADVRGDMGKADPVFRDVHDELLAAVGLGEKPQNELHTVDQLVQLAADADLQLDFDVDAVRALVKNPKEWGTLTVAEADVVGDAAKSIRHLARYTLNLELGAQRESKEKWFGDFEQHLKNRTPLPAEPMDTAAKTLWQKAKGLGRGADALLTDVPETYAHLLDAGDRNGPVHRLLVDARLAAREKATELAKKVLLRINEAWEKVPKDVRKLGDKRVDVAELLPVPKGMMRDAQGERLPDPRFAPVYTRQTLWMLFLNWGNEGNRQRIRDGMGWSDDNVGKALSLLSGDELKYLQGVLDSINSLWPELAAVHEKRTGLPLERVAATPISVNGETFAGGYFPLKYRGDLSRPGEVQEINSIKDLFPSNRPPATSRSFTKERAKKVTAAVDLSWGVVPAHLASVIHDISYGEWVRQAGSVLLDPRFKQLAAQHLGQERANQFLPWLRDVAGARADAASMTQADLTDKLAAFARNRAAIAVMGFNLPAILPQVLDPWNSFQENVPARHIAAAYVKVNSMLVGHQIPELALSKELPYRDAMVKTNMREQLAKMGPTGKGLGRAVSETAFALYELSDRYTSRVTWKAAFDHARSDGLVDAEAAQRADDVVRRAYASHDIAEKPPIMRSKKGLAGLVMFYSFANRLYNSLRRTAADTAQVFGDEESTATDKTVAVARVAAKLMMMGATGAAFSYLAGRGPKKDDDVEKWLAWHVALEPLNTVPFLGGAVESLVRGREVQIRTSPELALVQDSLNRLAKLVDKDEPAALIAAEAMLGLGAGVVGLPAGQLGRTGGYVEQLATGQERPRNPFDIASGLYYGKRKNQGRNPLSDIADAIGRQ